MSENRGKKFEQQIKEAFLKIPNVSVDRLHDQTNGYAGGANICDFIIYKKPYEYYIECKSLYGNTLSIHSNPKVDKNGMLKGFYGAISDTQWEGMVEKSRIPGVFAGVICWWIDKGITRYIPIQALEAMRQDEIKSVHYTWDSYVASYYIRNYPIITIPGKKKRVFFDYDMNLFFKEASRCQS